MKLLTFFIFLIFAISSSKSQIIVFNIGNYGLNLTTEENSTDSFKEYIVNPELTIQNVEFKNIPINVLSTFDELGNEVEVIDEKTSYNCALLDTVSLENYFKLKLIDEVNEFDGVRFMYQILGPDKRVSQTMTKIMPLDMVNEFLKKQLESKDALIIYNITFFSSSVQHYIKIGYMCFIFN